jgi:hypothetical protein
VLVQVEEWIPLGRDVYVLGLQECPPAMLPRLTNAVHRRMGRIAHVVVVVMGFQVMMMSTIRVTPAR